MSNPLMQLTVEDVLAIIQAQEIVCLRRLLATMKKHFNECPTPDQSQQDARIEMPLNLVQNDLNRLAEIETLRARYVRRVHVDPECTKGVAIICRDIVDMALESGER